MSKAMLKSNAATTETQPPNRRWPYPRPRWGLGSGRFPFPSSLPRTVTCWASTIRERHCLPVSKRPWIMRLTPARKRAFCRK